MCALTEIDPFYDCDEKWTIYLHDNDAWKDCQQYGTNACATWPPPIIHINLNQPLWYDACGHTTLLHELNHLKYRDKNYCH
jgi:hypothetical protein